MSDSLRNRAGLTQKTRCPNRANCAAICCGLWNRNSKSKIARITTSYVRLEVISPDRGTGRAARSELAGTSSTVSKHSGMKFQIFGNRNSNSSKVPIPEKGKVNIQRIEMAALPRVNKV